MEKPPPDTEPWWTKTSRRLSSASGYVQRVCLVYCYLKILFDYAHTLIILELYVHHTEASADAKQDDRAPAWFPPVLTLLDFIPLIQLLVVSTQLVRTELNLSTTVPPLFGSRLRDFLGLKSRDDCHRRWYVWAWLIVPGIVVVAVSDVVLFFYWIGSWCVHVPFRLSSWANTYSRRRMGISLVVCVLPKMVFNLYLFAFVVRTSHWEFRASVTLKLLSLEHELVFSFLPGILFIIAVVLAGAINSIIRALSDWATFTRVGYIVQEISCVGVFLIDVCLDIVVLVGITRTSMSSAHKMTWLGIGIFILLFQCYASALALLLFSPATVSMRSIKAWHWVTGVLFAPIILPIFDVITALAVVSKSLRHTFSRTKVPGSHKEETKKSAMSRAASKAHDMLRRLGLQILSIVVWIFPLYKLLNLHTNESYVVPKRLHRAHGRALRLEFDAGQVPQLEPGLRKQHTLKQTWLQRAEMYKSARLPAEGLLEAPFQAALQLAIFTRLSLHCHHARHTHDETALSQCNGHAGFGATVIISVLFAVMDMGYTLIEIRESGWLVGIGFWHQVQLLLSRDGSTYKSMSCWKAIRVTKHVPRCQYDGSLSDPVVKTAVGQNPVRENPVVAESARTQYIAAAESAQGEDPAAAESATGGHAAGAESARGDDTAAADSATGGHPAGAESATGQFTAAAKSLKAQNPADAESAKDQRVSLSTCITVQDEYDPVPEQMPTFVLDCMGLSVSPGASAHQKVTALMRRLHDISTKKVGRNQEWVLHITNLFEDDSTDVLAYARHDTDPRGRDNMTSVGSKGVGTLGARDCVLDDSGPMLDGEKSLADLLHGHVHGSIPRVLLSRALLGVSHYVTNLHTIHIQNCHLGPGYLDELLLATQAIYHRKQIQVARLRHDGRYPERQLPGSCLEAKPVVLSVGPSAADDINVFKSMVDQHTQPEHNACKVVIPPCPILSIPTPLARIKTPLFSVTQLPYSQQAKESVEFVDIEWLGWLSYGGTWGQFVPYLHTLPKLRVVNFSNVDELKFTTVKRLLRKVGSTTWEWQLHGAVVEDLYGSLMGGSLHTEGSQESESDVGRQHRLARVSHDSSLSGLSPSLGDQASDDEDGGADGLDLWPDQH